MIKKIFNFQFSIFNSSKGFTILESIVAIAVLSLSVSGAFSAVQQSLSQSIIAKDEVKAFYLAQEAVEIIRNKRDFNQLDKMNAGSGTWLSGITQDGSDPCYFGKTCRVYAKGYDPANSASFVDCSTDIGGNCPILKQTTDTFLYNYTTGNGTNFKREIQIELIQNDSLGNPIEIAVTVKISWTKGIINKEFKVKEHLFNWI